MASSSASPESDNPPDTDILLMEPEEAAAARHAAARLNRALRRQVPRGRITRSAASSPPRRWPNAALAAAQARLRPALCRLALRQLPHPARGLSRVPPRRLRHARAHRDAARRAEPQHRVSTSPTRAHPRPSPERCSSATSPTTSTTAMHRWPSAALRPSPSTRTSSASCSATPTSASSSTSPPSRRPRSSSSASSSPTRHATSTAYTTFSSASATSHAPSWRCAATRLPRSPRPRRSSSSAPGAYLSSCFPAKSASIAVEDAARVRDALGVPLPPGLPTAFLEASPDALLDIVRRYARTHGPFTTVEIAQRYSLPKPAVESDPAASRRSWPRDGRRLSSRRPEPRVDRRRSPAHDPSQVTRQAPQGDRASRTEHARSTLHALARRDRASKRTRCAA